ncbi:MAG: enoyl-CoA hydratase/isomerase family protein [Chloroflexota bacterium]
MPEYSTILVSADDRLGRISLNRPDKLNALSGELLNELIDAARWFDSQPQVRVVIVSGEGRAFSAGADIAESRDGDAAADQRSDLGRRMADAIEAMSAITIARIHGHCVGGAVVLAAACDLRVAGEGTRFSIPEVDLGIPLAWGGIPRLVREIGPALTKELVLTCRPFDAREAREAGFLNRVVPDDQLDAEVEALAASLLDKPGIPVRATKRHVDAITRGMIGIDHAWSDAHGLIAARADDESRAAAERYLERFRKRA